MGRGREARVALRRALSEGLRDGAPRQADWQRALLPQSAVEHGLPARVGDYTDFYASLEHATNCGTLLRGPERALQPNWRHLPVAYHGRASCV